MNEKELNEIRKAMGLPPTPDPIQQGKVHYSGSLEGKTLVVNSRGLPLSSYDLKKVAVIEPQHKEG